MGKKLKRHGGICLGHCDPPKNGCKLEDTYSDCSCLKCIIFCLKEGSYVESCSTPHQVELCNSLRINMTGPGVDCDVDCSVAVRREPFAAATLLVAALLLSHWPVTRMFVV